ncbi:MAG: acetylxylan esterase, partial [Planctomycetaceae bacterium]|nr:acetylxylan esterase [Planctomycetaceae bacterium]
MILGALLIVSSLGFAVEPAAGDGDQLAKIYFANQTAEITSQTFAEINSLSDWTDRRDQYHDQLLEMLGLDPFPERTPLNARITGSVESDGVIAERIHFQSRPGLYVTGNFYRPVKQDAPLPAILYVCGHGRVKRDGVSLGNKTHYQHHGAWFARNGYVCLTIDTIQLGEIEGIHHGTYREKMWWWNNRGYTPAGVEAWNCVRALDYLQSRDEVDGERIGVTGRSGGGAYSWWIAAIDERIKVAVPVAGITSLKNHVVDGCVEGHCDCMYMVNTYRWDYPMVAALVAPRPLLISNTDKDRIFPLDGVVDVYTRTKKIYQLYDADDKLGLHITEGPHKDTQELRVHAFRWFNHYLRDDDSLITSAAAALFDQKDLKVFPVLPSDENVTSIHETFVPAVGTDNLPKEIATARKLDETTS